jgi:hypothetical protein
LVAATATQIVVTGRLAAADDPAGTSLALYALSPAQDDSSYTSHDKYLVVAVSPTGATPLGSWEKKGLSAVQMIDDADSLGASSSAVNVALNDIMLASDTNPADTITFRSNGQDYYFNATAVASLDRQLEVLTRDRIYPYLILLITPTDPANSAGPEPRFPGAAPRRRSTRSTRTPPAASPT